MSDEQWENTMRINLTGTFLCGREVAKVMVKDGTKGRIVNISSTDGLFAERHLSDYATSKAGMHGLTRAMAYDLANYGITVNAVAPGWIRTPMSEQYLSEQIMSGEEKVTPVGRIGLPYDIATGVAWLVDPDSSYVSGAIIVIDGGQTAVQWTPEE
jgi:NAD(P)-dependent dehydrogenase (short-subunit alcohol dehydrogenase family)